MPKEKIQFPKNFLWGVSTSAYQIEGNITNDWSQWEHSETRKKQLQHRGKNPKDYMCGQACNSYHKYIEDLDLLAELGCGAYRMGLEWARIEPEEGNIKEEAIEYYRKILNEAKKRNLQIVLTLWHWSNPVWIAEKGGWANPKTVEYYTRYVATIIKELGNQVDYWITLNEPMVHVTNGYLIGIFPPHKKSFSQARKVFNNLSKAHRDAYNLIHQAYPNDQVSITKLTNDFQPAGKWYFVEKRIAKLLHYHWNEKFLLRIKDHLDYIGVDYYFHDRVVWHPPFKKNKNENVTDIGWEIYPQGIYNVLKYLSSYGKPILILENGLADAQDKKRPDFIKDHLYYIKKAMDEGVDVRGYFHWSLLDNFEWAEGWWPKFGLYKLDPNTFERIPRTSAKIYGKICRTGELTIK